MIDTHAHIYDEAFDEDREAMMARAKAQGIEKILMPNVDLNTLPKMLAVEARYPAQCHSMLGLHPCYVDEQVEETLAEMAQSLDQHPFIAIGEIGMDLFHDQRFEEEQKHAFRIQIEWAKQRNLPIVIHTRKSMSQTLKILKEAQDGSLTGVFHCFVTHAQDAKDIIDLGFHLGIGGVSTFKNSKLQNVYS